ncbi:mucin-4-like [Betta splendens]|uniref:Mucin-4-like n=1 Tax=Betta splendens TaxID=158456 RepID=A0A6P7L4K9_BETSP|nr:mucin-4-like [Betta splendens]
MAEDPNGNAHSCSALGTNCFIRGLSCGQNYTASVISTNLLCNSTSTQVNFVTAPCPPTGIQAIRDCDTNQALIAWNNEQLPGLYTATLEDESKAKLNCTTNTVNNCSITSPPCGKRFNVTVTYNDGHCLSYSTPVSMDSVPCGPVDVKANVSCVTGQLTVTWSSPVTAPNYTTVVSRQADQPLRCNSASTQCTTSGLSCGSSYAVTVFSITGTCLSLPSSVVTVQSLPCPPTNITATHTCAPDPVPVSWVASDSAKYYTAVAVSSDGYMSQCQTNTTSCALSQLQCGDVYSITVAGTDDTCTGQPSNNFTLVTEPCTPTNVSSRLFCSDGVAKVSWAPSVNALSYAVKATSSDQILNCTTSGTNCTLSDLLCDHTYDIQVSATDGTCVSNYSSLFRHNKVPCAPQNISTSLACGTNILTVSWTSAPEPLNYSVTAVILGGNTTSASCRTSTTSCDLDGLQCGQTYNVSVQASSGSCIGPCSSAQTVETAPCPPLGLTAVAGCGTNALLASWNSSLGATSYTTTVTGPNGFSSGCSSSDLTCSVSDLHCASQYTVTVASVHATCTSSLSQTHVTTGPCDPVNVTSVLICGSDAATVSWEAAAGAVSYIAVAQDSSSHLYASCSTNTTSCRLNRLQCGRAYNLTVLAEDQDATCNSTGSNTAVLTTAPCTPPVLSSNLICGTNYSSASWEQVANAVNYTVTATTATRQQISCSSATATCDLADLVCSETYTAAVVAQGSQCQSAPSSSINITTVPCSPSFVTAQYSCDANAAALTWTDSVGGVSFWVQVDGGGYRNTYQTTNTSCVFGNLPCGLNFKATVQVQGPHCSSLPSVSDTLESVPCAPSNVSASMVCSNNSALVTWVGTPTAVGYNVTATAQNGHTSSCYTTTTSCEVSIKCGKTYNITVTPHSQTCTGNPSSVYSFSAGLCAPCNVSMSSACGADAVSWSTVTGAQMYRATATAGDGTSQTCSSNSSSCDFPHFLCGQTYGIAVATLDRGCWSTPSPAVNLTTVPCVPTNLTGQICCEDKVLTVKWDQSSETGTTYMLQAEIIGGAPTVYTTVNTTYTLNALCGQTYTFRVAAQDGNCNSSYSPPIEVMTEPCQPVIVAVDALCQSDSVYISWNQTSNAVNYIITVSGNLGYVNTYNTSQTLLSATLPCGQDYNATLRAHGAKCYSLTSSAAFTTTPCVPRNVTTQVQCRLNASSVSWEPSNGAKTYTALATGLDGRGRECTSNTTSCSWSDLHCGEQYSVVVTADNGNCSSLASNASTIYMMPCVPMNVTVTMDCASDTAVVSWSPSRGAVQYLVTAHSLYDSVSCQTSGLYCTLYNLTCGSGYAAQVVAVGDTCSSVPSTSVTFNSSPCPPRNVSAHVSCLSNDMTVSWSAVRDADQFLVSALPSDGGLSRSCASTNTSCSISGVTCGNTFTVQVASVTGSCSSQQSEAPGVMSAPCQPQGVTGSFDCVARSPIIRWDAAAGADSYTVTAAGEAGRAADCSTAANTTCEVKGLSCGLSYNFSVTAANPQCESPPSGSIQLKTEPCVPTNLSVAYDNSEAQVTWNKAKGASSYSVQAQTPQGPAVTCNGTGTWCLLIGLQCSRIYNITVTPQNAACNDSVVSDPYVLITEPCPPTNVQASGACDQLTSTVSWQQSGLAVGYVAHLDDWNGHYTSCSGSSTDASCSVSGLTCGTAYDVWVEAVGQQYNSSGSAAVLLTSAPCRPADIKVDVSCQSDGAAVVSWNSTYGTANFSLSADVGGSLRTLCATQQDGCNVTGLSCGQTYTVGITASNAQCVAAAVNASLTTRPCPPQHVAVDLLCETQAVVVSWDQSLGVDLYEASATSVSGGRVQTCNSTGASCQFTSLSCGDTYNVTVVAHSRGCWSRASNPVSVQTEPCQPVIVAVDALCQSDSVYISWNQTSNAVNYIIAVSGNLGYVNTYNTSQTLLSATLPCGQDYNATLRAHGAKCYSLTSSAAFTTTPCVPRNVTTQVQCRLNASSVSWEPSNGAKTYMALATGLDGRGRECTSNTTSCSWSDLHCGEQYSVVVTADNGNCSSLASNASTIYMSPCVPKNLVSSVNCSGKVVSLSWDASNGSTSYTVSAYAANQSSTLSTYMTTASFSDLTCGQNYSIRVKPHSQNCAGCSDAQTYVETWPCPPSGVSIVQDCVSGNVTAAWQASQGSDSYTATLQSGAGASQTCTSTSNTCSIPHLSCGSNFSVSVTASNRQCNTTSSQTAGLTSVPCVPMNVTVTMDCASDTAMLSWSPSRGAVQYLVTATSLYDTVTCQTSGLNCTLYNHTCGSRYTAQVVAVGDTCSSAPSETVKFNSSFCPPDQLNVTLDCIDQSALLSWTPSVNAVQYYARAQAENGNKLCCHSNIPSCVIQGLECGTVYNFTVKTSDGTCNSSFSNPVQMGAVPCPPDSVTVQLLPMQNQTQVLHFNWNQSSCMNTEYLVMLKGSLLGNSHTLVNVSSYWNNRTYFEIPLPCSTSYTAAVESRNTAGTSDPSVFLINTTAPCPPPGVICTSNSSLATVSWSASVFATEYTVYDNSVTPRAKLCNTADLSCSLPYSTCTSLVITASNSAGESEAENVATTGRRRRDLSY